MAEVCPFRGVRYNQGTVGDLAKVICPPYDIITPQQQEFYYKRSEYNAIRLEYVQTQAGVDSVNKYQRAANTFQRWLGEGVLQVEDYPAFYLHDHYFTHLGERRKRRGLISRVRLGPWGSSVYPHEETLSKAKSDRLQLMRACQANFSPIFTLYQDLEGKIAGILSEVSKDEPVIELSDSGEGHVVWAIAEPELIHQVSDFFVGQSLYIADGHHRYETALAYQHERACLSLPAECKEPGGSLIGKEAFNYVMMTLVDFADPGLFLLPIYRLVRGIASSALSGLKDQLGQFFVLESVSSTVGLIDSWRDAMRAGAVTGIVGLEDDALIVLKRRQDVCIEDMLPKSHSLAYRSLNVSLLPHLILDRMLGLAPANEDIAYGVDVGEACRQVAEGKYQLAFLLSPLQPEMAKAVADAGDRMPQKSTYFYPKLPTGLVLNYFS